MAGPRCILTSESLALTEESGPKNPKNTVLIERFASRVGKRELTWSQAGAPSLEPKVCDG